MSTVLDPVISARLKRDSAGLVPAVVQQHDTNEVLMLAWMNDEALHRTLTTGRATYFSRSRGRLWVKGETSGHYQAVTSVSLDCDGDTLLVRVDQTGPACHTGERTCFHRPLETNQTEELETNQTEELETNQTEELETNQTQENAEGELP